ncbi:MAG TPA: RecQ family ATP-dependent DNA helicase [Flammeovirgaceae bacterium]|nr:RecQ family ATP-dependent DNA helicase [Flammeovirgaceae bacterium]
MSGAHQVLQQVFGYECFRPGQEEIINSVLAGKDTFALLPTGGGKSLCYQVPALIFEGLTLVVTPLISLMLDQVEALRARGVRAYALHSGLDHRQQQVVLDNCAFGDVKLLYCAPERLASDEFRARLPHLNVRFLAVDEAHCVSEWGHDFRPSYLLIKEVRQELGEVPMLALTATATPQIEQEVIDLLGMQEPAVFRTSFSRSNLVLVVRQVEDKEARLAEILQKVTGSAIVYVSSRRKARDLAVWLQKHKQIAATFYHAGLKAAEREARQQQWKSDRVRVMVATNAFGMGIDKHDVRLVVHVDVPASLEAYYQEAGRAGRDGQRAYAVLLHHPRDDKSLQQRFELAHPDVPYLRHVYQCLANYYKLAVGSGYFQSFDIDLSDFAKRYKLQAVKAYSALKRLEEEGLISLSEGLHLPSVLKINLQKQALYEFQVKHARYDDFIKGILRLYGGRLFAEFVKIDEQRLSHFLKSEEKQVRDYLSRLHNIRVVTYIPQTDSPKITYLTPRVHADQLFLNTKRLNMLRQAAADRLQAVQDYLTTKTCRMQHILQYFGEKAEACGRCDRCLDGKKKEVDLTPRILALLANGPLEARGLLRQFTWAEEEQVLDTIRQLLESKKISREEDKLRLL